MFRSAIPSFVHPSLALPAGGLPTDMTQAQIRHPDSEIIELAAAEGHDAEISSNAGFVSSDPENPSWRRVSLAKSLSGDKEIDIEKEAATRPQSSSSDDEEVEGEAVDPNVVSWDGPDDHQKYCDRHNLSCVTIDILCSPMNWSPAWKWGSICVVSGLTFLTPLGSSIFAYEFNAFSP